MKNFFKKYKHEYSKISEAESELNGVKTKGNKARKSTGKYRIQICQFLPDSNYL